LRQAMLLGPHRASVLRNRPVGIECAHRSNAKKKTANAGQ
jgi:hypothetical protein